MESISRSDLRQVFESQDSLYAALHEGLQLFSARYDFLFTLLIVHAEGSANPVMHLYYPGEKAWSTPEKRTIVKSLNQYRHVGMVSSESSCKVIPLIAGGKQQGLLYIEFCEEVHCSPPDWISVTNACDEFADWIQSAGFSIKPEIPLDNVLNLNLAFSGFDTKASLDEVQLKLVNEIREGLDCEAASIVFFGNNHDEVLVKKSLISQKDWIYQVGVRRGEGLVGFCLENGRGVISNHLDHEAGYQENVDMVPGLDARSLMYVPLMDSDNIVGLVQVINKKTGEFEESDLKILNSLANSVLKPLVFLQTIHQLRVINAHLEASRWELIRSRNTLRSLIDNLPDSLYIINRMYRIVAINNSRSARVDVDPRSLVGNICFEVLYNRGEPCPNCQVPETFFNKRVTNRTERDWQESGEAYEWEVNTYPIFDETGAVIQVILVEKDITDRRRMEMIVTQSEKMAAVGQLAAGIAHEINNPLTVVLANAQILMKELPDTEDWRELAELINKAGTRALHTVRNLLDFARREKLDFEETDVNDTIERALEMLHHEFIDRSVEMVYIPGTDLQWITASPGNLQSVWVNLIMNALDSLDANERQITVKTMQKGHEIRVSISDTGQGIPADGMNRIFEPFFTTKDPGKGTGLGLSICHRIIKQHGGHIEVDSQIGQGTIFTVILPVF